MKIDLSGKTAIVTGSSKGIGFGAAKGLANNGATVVINGRNETTVSHAIDAIKTTHPDAKLIAHVGNLGTKEGCDELIKAIPACDILVNNLGIYSMEDFFETSDETWDKFYEINIMSGVRLSRHYAKQMINNRWGRILFISSESGLNIPEDMIHYGFTKTANIAIAKGLAKRLAGTGVTVNSILPGPTLSDGLVGMIEGIAKENNQTVETAAKEFVMAKRPSSVIQRAATIEEVANMIVYAASKEASATTGASLRVDGGVVNFL
ncbi:MAG: short-chain dehydrogenase [Rhodomicrobium sp.]|nr:MAG: short-chain dehydrogenase [Rhodomicrobium sp.]